MGRIYWTSEDIARLRELYGRTDIDCSDMAKILGRPLCSIYGKAQALGLSRPEIFRSIAGKKGTNDPRAIAHRFQKGQIPANKGKKMPSEVYERCAPTMFKKGNKPANHKPVGSERVNIYGYIEIKVAEPNKWKLKHRLLWEEAHGPIPPGHIVSFRNGNGQDVRLENLRLISRAEQLKNENSLTARYPEELVEVIRLKGALNRKINNYQKHKENEQKHIT